MIELGSVRSGAFRCFGGIALLAAGASCSVFDESLLESDDSLRLSDTLTCAVPLNESVNAYRTIDTSALRNNLSVLPNCLGEVSAPGNEGFFAVDMRQGEKWHFHVQVESESIDPAIYVLDSCSDSRSCRDTYWGINACGPGENEHFSFVAPATSKFYVGIDSLTPGGEPIQVFAVRAECGDGEKQHSEFCDDGNDDPSDGCQDCRPVIVANGPEVEPNDGPLDADVLTFPADGRELQLTGTLGSRCDFDFFEFSLSEPARLTWTLSGAQACGRADLQLREPGDPNPFEVAASSGADICAMPQVMDLAAGSHIIRLTSRRDPTIDAAPANYTLRRAREGARATSALSTGRASTAA